MCYANLVLARGAERFADELAERRHRRPDRARPAAGGGAGGAARPATPPASRWSRWSRRRRPRSASAPSASAPAASSTPSRSSARPASARRWPTLRASRRARQGRTPSVPVARRLRHRDARAGRAGGGRRRRRRDRRLPAGARRGRGRVTPRRAVGALSRAKGSRAALPHRVRRRMGLVLATTAGLIVWIVLWALGAKAIDSFMITVTGARRRHGPHGHVVLARQSPQLSLRISDARRFDALTRFDGRAVACIGATVCCSPLIGIASLRRDLASTFTGSLGLPRDRPCSGRCRVRQRWQQQWRQHTVGHRHHTLTIYSSLPLQGASRLQSLSVINGEKLALEQAGGNVGKYTVKYVSLDDAKASAGKWDPGQTSAERAQGGPGQVDDRLPRRVRLGRVGDLDPDPQRGGDPADLALEHVRRPDPVRGRRQGRAGQVLPVGQAHVRPRRPGRPDPGRRAGRPAEGRGLHEDLHPERQADRRRGHRRRRSAAGAKSRA